MGKIYLCNSYYMPTVIYGPETLLLTKADAKRLKTAKMTFLRSQKRDDQLRTEN